MSLSAALTVLLDFFKGIVTVLGLYLSDLLLQQTLDLTTLPRRNIGVKYCVNLLKSLAGSLRVHEEDVNSHSEAEDTKDDVGAPLNVGERRRDKERESEVESGRSVSGSLSIDSKVTYAQLVAAARPTPFARHLRGNTSEQ